MKIFSRSKPTSTKKELDMMQDYESRHETLTTAARLARHKATTARTLTDKLAADVDALTARARSGEPVGGLLAELMAHHSQAESEAADLEQEAVQAEQVVLEHASRRAITEAQARRQFFNDALAAYIDALGAIWPLAQEVHRTAVEAGVVIAFGPAGGWAGLPDPRGEIGLNGTLVNIRAVWEQGGRHG